MPKVEQPLFSEEAHGGFLKGIIFQGKTAKRYRSPKDKRTAEQIANRAFFTDISKVVREAGETTKGYFLSAFGSRWFQEIFGFAKRDEHEFYSDALLEYATFSEENRGVWSENAPFVSTWGDAGQIFFGLIRLIYWQFDYIDFPLNGVDLWGELESELAATWWLTGSSGAAETLLADELGNLVVDELGNYILAE